MGKHRCGIAGSLGCIAVALMGCMAEMAEEEEEPRAPELVGTGVYEVTVTTVVDTCAPMRLDGRRGLSDVFVYEGGEELRPMLPVESAVVAEGFERQVLEAEDGYSKALGRGDVVGEECGGEAIYLTRLSVKAADESGLTVRRWTEWKVITPCQEGREERSPELPHESCSVKQDLRYDLVKACGAPCQLWNHGGGEYECECR